MSWSISLSGPKGVVEREIADALLVLDKALDWVIGAEDENNLSVNVGGYASWNTDTKEVTYSNVSFSVGESKPVPIPPAGSRSCE